MTDLKNMGKVKDIKKRKIPKPLKTRAEEYIDKAPKETLDRFVDLLGGEAGSKKIDQAYPQEAWELREFIPDGLVYICAVGYPGDTGIGECGYALSNFGRRVARLHIRNTKYEITKKIPPPEYAPPKKGKPGGAAMGITQRVTIYPYDLLDIGDSFFVPETYEQPYPIQPVRQALLAQNNYWRDGDGNTTKFFICKERFLKKHGEDGVRVWRVQ